MIYKRWDNPMLCKAMDLARLFEFSVFPLFEGYINKNVIWGRSNYTKDSIYSLCQTLVQLKSATQNTDEIIDFWTRWPDAYIGIATGKKSNIWVLDVHRQNCSESELKIIDLLCKELPPTMAIKNEFGGKQYLFPLDEHTNIQSKREVFKGIDVIANNGYVVAPCMFYPTYLNLKWESIVETLTKGMYYAPDWLLNEIKQPSHILNYNEHLN